MFARTRLCDSSRENCGGKGAPGRREVGKREGGVLNFLKKAILMYKVKDRLLLKH